MYYMLWGVIMETLIILGVGFAVVFFILWIMTQNERCTDEGDKIKIEESKSSYYYNVHYDLGFCSNCFENKTINERLEKYRDVCDIYGWTFSNGTGCEICGNSDLQFTLSKQDYLDIEEFIPLGMDDGFSLIKSMAQLKTHNQQEYDEKLLRFKQLTKEREALKSR